MEFYDTGLMMVTARMERGYYYCIESRVRNKGANILQDDIFSILIFL